MKRLRYPLGLLACLLVSAAVPLAYGGSTTNHAVTPAQLKALAKRVTKLEKEMNNVNALGACITKAFAPISVYGVPPGEGYVYSQNGTTFPTTAVDITNEGDSPDAILVTMNPSCISSSRSTSGHVSLRRASGARILFLHLKQSPR
jgi:hypothetical protein